MRTDFFTSSGKGRLKKSEGLKLAAIYQTIWRQKKTCDVRIVSVILGRRDGHEVMIISCYQEI